MRVLIAPDSFKGTLSAAEAASAVARGVRRALPDAVIDECPLADGGEGTLDVVAGAKGAETWTIETHDLLHVRVEARVARWRDEVVLGGRWCTLIESAQVIGLPRVPIEQRDPLKLSSAALAELLNQLRIAEEDVLIIAIGGSATVDGGIGCAREMGVRFLDVAGVPLDGIAGRDLARIDRINSSSSIGRLRALCDVDNPLLGSNGAGRVFGPQKGASPEDVELLERGLGNLVRMCEEAGLNPDPDAPGAGAAGGLGFGLATFFGAELVRGSAWVCDAVGFDERAKNADLIITGEGRLDAQTARGKVIHEVTSRTTPLGVPVVAIAGAIESGFRIESLGLASATALQEIAGSTERSRNEPATWLEEAGRRVIEEFAAES